MARGSSFYPPTGEGSGGEWWGGGGEERGAGGREEQRGRRGGENKTRRNPQHLQLTSAEITFPRHKSEWFIFLAS